MTNHQSFSNFSSISELFDLESLKMLLKSIPTSVTSFYFESKSIYGFKENLQEEIQDLLIELQATESNLKKIIKIFLLFIDKNESIMKEKEEQNFHLMTENENLILKLSLRQRPHDPSMDDNLHLLEKNSQLTEEIEILDRQCQKYEEMIEEMKTIETRAGRRKKNSFDINEFKENYEKIKENFPRYFCKCLGDYDEIKQKNANLIEKNSILKQENEEFMENIGFLKQKLEKFENLDKRISYENERLKCEIAKIQKNREQFLLEIEEVSSFRKSQIPYLRMRSLSPQKNEENQEPQGDDIKNKYCRNPLLRKKKEKNIQEIEKIRQNVRRKTRNQSRKFTSLLSEIQKSLEDNKKDNENNVVGTMDHIFEQELEEKEIITITRTPDNYYDLSKRNTEKEEEIFSLKKKIEENEFQSFSSIEKIIERQHENILVMRKKTSMRKTPKSRNLTINNCYTEKNSKTSAGFVEENQENVTVSMKSLEFNQGIGLSQNNNNIPSKIKQEKIHKKATFSHFIIFVYLMIMNLIGKMGLWVIEKKDNKGNGLLRRIVDKGKNIAIAGIRAWLRMSTVVIIAKIKAGYGISNLIKNKWGR